MALSFVALPLIKKEIKAQNTNFYQNYVRNKEDWHNGKTFKYEGYGNLELNEKYEQYKTIIVKNDESEAEYFIYDEIITGEIDSQKKYMSILILFDNKEKKIQESIIFLKENFIIQVIRSLTYEDFKLEIIANKEFSDLQENETTTFTKTPFLDFLENVNIDEEKVEKEEKKRKLINKYEKKYKKMRVLFWIGAIILFLLSWGFIPILSTYILPNLGIGLTAGSTATSIVAGLTTGAIITVSSLGGYKFKKWLFPKMKEELEIKLKNKIKKHDQKIKDEVQKELYLSWTSENKETRIFNAFKEIINKNKNKDFETLSQELNDKFKENRLNLAKINYEQELKKISKNQTNLKDNPEHIEEDYRGYYPKIFAN